jgi:hypothetical protein
VTKQGMTRAEWRFVGRAAGFLLLMTMIALFVMFGIREYERAHQLHYMYSSCDDPQAARNASNCTRRIVIHPDDSWTRQYRDRFTGKWTDEEPDAN